MSDDDNDDKFLAAAMLVAKDYVTEHFDKWSEEMREDFEGGAVMALFDTITWCGWLDAWSAISRRARP